jgi:hypothetical protein
LHDLLERKQLAPIEEGNFFGHAIGAAQIAAVGDADAEVVVNAVVSVKEHGNI